MTLFSIICVLWAAGGVTQMLFTRNNAKFLAFRQSRVGHPRNLFLMSDIQQVVILLLLAYIFK